jgi:hypothetical protein
MLESLLALCLLYSGSCFPTFGSANEDNKNFDSNGSECYLQHLVTNQVPDFFPE